MILSSNIFTRITIGKQVIVRRCVKFYFSLPNLIATRQKIAKNTLTFVQFFILQ